MRNIHDMGQGDGIESYEVIGVRGKTKSAPSAAGPRNGSADPSVQLPADSGTRGRSPMRHWNRPPKAVRSDFDRRLGHDLAQGGFPEAVDIAERDRVALLRSYVDVVILRDVIERH